MFKNKILFKFLALLLTVATFISAKILVVVDREYYNDNSWGIKGKDKVDRYINDVRYIDNENVELLLYTNIRGTNIQKVSDLWYRLCERYNISTSQGDRITGVVLIGNLPVPAYKEYDKGSYWYVAFDYPYMNLFDNSMKQAFSTSSDLKLIFDYEESSQTFTSIRPNYTGVTSDVLDVWVSRIYADNLEGLRSEYASWGSFLEPHEIISRYFDKVHDRMTLPAKTPNRAMGMGHIGEWYTIDQALEDLKNDVLCFENLPVNNRLYVTESLDPNEEKINCPMNWQSQLQAGPYGNINQGATGGNILGNFSNQIYSEYSSSDIFGHEWVGVYEHGSPSLTAFDGSHNEGGKNGTFYTYNNGPFPKSFSSGGYANSPYIMSKLDDKGGFTYQNTFGDGGSKCWEADVELLGRWRADNVAPGNYSLYLYLDQDMIPAGYEYTDMTYFNIYSYVNKTACEKNSNSASQRRTVLSSYIPDIDARSKASVDGWVKICDYDATFNPSYLQISVHPFHKQSNNGENKAWALSAFKIVDDGTLNERVFYMDDPEHFFTKADPKTRTFYDMQDDGGQSRANFFLFNSCHFNQFLQPNNIGLSYGMGHAGLMSFGAATNNTAGYSYNLFVNDIRDNISFGEAMLNFIRTRNSSSKIFSLVGAGTLKPAAYVPFEDPRITSVDLEPFIGKAKDIDAGADGSVYMVHESGKYLQKWDGSKWGPGMSSPQYQQIISFAVDNFGKPWIVLDNGEIYNGFGPSWTKSSVRGKYIDINDIGKVVIVNEDQRSVSISNGSYWSYLYFEISGYEKITKAVIDNNGIVWAITDYDKIYKLVGANWENVPFVEQEDFQDLCVDKDGVLTISTDSKALYTLTGLGWVKKDLNAGYANFITTDKEGNYWLSYDNQTHQIVKENRYENMLNDGDFNSFGNWDWEIQNDGSASIYQNSSLGLSYAYDESGQVKNTAFCANVTNGGNYSWSAILAYKHGVKIEYGRKYRVSFWARMDNPTSQNNEILATVSLNRAPWTEYGPSYFNLTNDYRRYEFEFEMNYSTDPYSILQFCIGEESKTVYFDNVRLEDITE